MSLVILKTKNIKVFDAGSGEAVGDWEGDAVSADALGALPLPLPPCAAAVPGREFIRAAAVAAGEPERAVDGAVPARRAGVGCDQAGGRGRTCRRWRPAWVAANC